MLSALAPGTVLGMPVSSVALCAAAVLVALLLLVAAVAWPVLRRVDRADLPAALLGLAHVISALCGLLPWGKPMPPPSLPQQSRLDAESVPPAVVVLRGEASADSPLIRGEDA